MQETIDNPSILESTLETSDPRQSLWASLSAPERAEDFYWSWLQLLGTFVPNGQTLLLIGRKDDGGYQPFARWPEEGTLSSALTEVVEQAIDEECGLVEQVPGSARLYAVAYPVHISDRVQFIVAAELRAKDEIELAACMERLQWGSAWLEAFARRQEGQTIRDRLERMTVSLDLLAQVLDEPGYDNAAMALVTELSRLFTCDRVSLGLLDKDRMRVRALSHSAQFGERMNLIQAIGAAMDEAVLQGDNLVWSRDGSQSGTLIVRDHQTLASQFGPLQILTIPLFRDDHYYGAITFERCDNVPFTSQQIAACRDLSALAGAALQDKWLNDRHILIKTRHAGAEQLRKLFGPRHLIRKLVTSILVLLVVFFSLMQGDYRLSADTVLEGAVRRMIVAPFDGYIVEALARAGDTIDENDLLCRLDDRDLRLERLSLVSQQSQLSKQRQEALANHSRAEVNILSAQLSQVEAQFTLIETQLSRTNLSAPFRGLVVNGDLSQRLGGSVRQGEVLFEIAPLDAYRVILKVDERRITDIRIGQSGELVLTSLPDEKFIFEVGKITPITTTDEGMNFFRVEAQLAQLHPGLRPGMEGVGKVMIDRRNLFSIWTREMREWLTLWFWSWWP